MKASATRRAAVVAGLALSVLLGAVTAALGAALPLLRAAYGSGNGGGGTEVVVAYNLGALLALLGSGRLERRLPASSLVSWYLAAFAAGCAGMPSAPAWWVLTAWALVAGVGFGGLVLYANAWFGRAGGAAGVRGLGALHAAFGAGATAGPLLVGGTGAVRELLWAVAVLAVCCVPFRRAGDPGADGAGPPEAGSPGSVPPGHGTAPAGPPPRPSPGRGAGPGAGPAAPGWRPAAAGAVAPRGLLVACAAAAFLYAGLEAAIGALEATHLSAAGHTPEDAARLSALFWAGLTVGRLLLPLAAGRVSPVPLVLGALCAGACALTAAAAAGLAPASYAVAGICLAAVFPTLLAWAVTVLPGPRRISGVLLTANLAGSAVLPFVLGRLTTGAVPASIPLALAALAVVAAVPLVPAARAAGRRFRREPPPSPAPKTPSPTPSEELEASP
ncbi:MFS transporter [Streptomyces sp. NPDC013953]|uniref:MFS transporter n=1 Tax=Streptomyces sp. NPDC013953 TaxID=3364868 RepID=UPI0036FEFF3A